MYAAAKKRIGGADTLTDSDIDDFQNAKGRLFRLVSDWGWHSREEICAIAGVRGPARLWDLKDAGVISGYETRQVPGSKRLYEYRALPPSSKPKAKQLELIASPTPRKNFLDW